jgi:hypothetical protein
MTTQHPGSPANPTGTNPDGATTPGGADQGGADAAGSGLDLDALTAACTEPADRHAAWRFATAFARDWSPRPLREGDGVEEHELAAAETRLGLPLPAALREAYLLLGRRTDLTSRQDELLAPAELHLDGDRGVLIFRIENQSCAYWGIRVADLDQDDPPVLVRPDVATPIAEHWEPWLGHVSTEITEILLAEALADDDPDSDADGDPESGSGAGGYHVDAIWEPAETHYEILEHTYRPLPLPAYPPAPNPGSRWYTGPDVLLREDGALIQLRARTPAALDAARATFPGAAWLNAG